MGGGGGWRVRSDAAHRRLLRRNGGCGALFFAVRSTPSAASWRHAWWTAAFSRRPLHPVAASWRHAWWRSPSCFASRGVAVPVSRFLAAATWYSLPGMQLAVIAAALTCCTWPGSTGLQRRQSWLLVDRALRSVSSSRECFLGALERGSARRFHGALLGLAERCAAAAPRSGARRRGHNSAHTHTRCKLRRPMGSRRTDGVELLAADRRRGAPPMIWVPPLRRG